MNNHEFFKKLKLCLVFIVVLNLQLFAQPKERLKNRYKEPNMSYGAPYTMFDISDFTSNKSIGVTPAAARNAVQRS